MVYKQFLATETLHRWYRSTVANMVHHKRKSEGALSVFCTLANVDLSGNSSGQGQPVTLELFSNDMAYRNQVNWTS